jgi:8-oxo-dGTP pyrophosphatase MutT (NUDIX family)
MDQGSSRSGPRPRYVHRVTADDIGDRVSVRHVLTSGLGDATPGDPASGPDHGGDAPLTDVVGRLVGLDDDALLVIDRHGRLHVIGQRTVVASRVIPPHPRRDPEPRVGTRATPLERAAARVLLLDPRDRALLVGHVPADDRVVWTAPGGGLEPGESHEQAATREVVEELGVTADLGPWIWRRRVTFSFRGVWIDQDERWFLARTSGFDPATAPLDDHGTTSARWWGVDDLRHADAEVAPARLAEHLDRLVRDGPPAEPIDVGR